MYKQLTLNILKKSYSSTQKTSKLQFHSSHVKPIKIMCALSYLKSLKKTLVHVPLCMQGDWISQMSSLTSLASTSVRLVSVKLLSTLVLPGKKTSLLSFNSASWMVPLKFPSSVNFGTEFPSAMTTSVFLRTLPVCLRDCGISPPKIKCEAFNEQPPEDGKVFERTTFPFLRSRSFWPAWNSTPTKCCWPSFITVELSKIYVIVWKLHNTSLLANLPWYISRVRKVVLLFPRYMMSPLGSRVRMKSDILTVFLISCIWLGGTVKIALLEATLFMENVAGTNSVENTLDKNLRSDNM